jgi:hypothetical protein
MSERSQYGNTVQSQLMAMWLGPSPALWALLPLSSTLRMRPDLNLTNYIYIYDLSGEIAKRRKKNMKYTEHIYEL